MGPIELLLTALGLSMDAMAVAVCKGLSVRRMRGREAIACGLWFGGFQALMPLIGYGLASGCTSFLDPVLVEKTDHWVAFVLLALIGANMIRESRGVAETVNASFSPRAMLPLAVATSIDAMVAGVAFAATLPPARIGVAVGLIGGITCALSAVGVWIGHVFGARFRSGAECLGGTVLILMGLRILAEDLGILSFLASRLPFLGA